MVIKHSEYDLFQKDILKKLADDAKFFYSCIAGNYYVSAQRFKCSVRLSKHRLEEARRFWLDDLDRLLARDSDDETVELDEFKQCAFLTFWLRRHCPLEAIEYDELAESQYKSTRELMQKWYAIYGNEVTSIEIGSTICINYCASSIAHHVSSEVEDPRRAKFISRDTYLKKFLQRKDFWADFAMIMKHKSNSPHSITLIYEALFGLTLGPVRNRNLQSGKT